jgi:flavin-dependent dehydrogenase
MYDVIVVGARVAGASTAMLLARRGLNVLVVDRAHFPSDTLSTHQVQVPGIARLHRWGLLDAIEAAGTPPTRHVRWDAGEIVLEGRFPQFEGVDALYSPRRRVLDSLLLDAARAAGAEVRERFPVDELTVSDGRVTGVRSGRHTETARMVIGADGRHSLVARAVDAEAYRTIPPLTVGYYSYWAGVPLAGGELYMRPEQRRAIGAWPTNDGLTLIFVAAPHDEFRTFKADLEQALLRSLAHAGDLGERVRAGERAERVYGSGDLQNRFRVPHGPGWALVGDAGLVMDPVTGQGIAHAFRDAELLADAIATGGESALTDYRRQRDAAALPMYELTADVARIAPLRPEQWLLMRALEGRPEEVSRFLGVITGAVPIPAYFAPRNLLRLIGVRGMVTAARSRRKMAA